jgi:hypothetical protein
MDIVTTIWSYLLSFPTIRLVVSIVVAFHHSTVGKYLEGWAVQKLNDVLPDGSPAETMVNKVYQEVKDM